LTARPNLRSHFANAARAAVLAAAGRGHDSADLDAMEQQRWRDQARKWIEDDLNRLRNLIQQGPLDSVRSAAMRDLEKLRRVLDLPAIRASDDDNQWPPPEREAWLQLGADLDSLLEELNPRPS
jgi:hypothetical protein